MRTDQELDDYLARVEQRPGRFDLFQAMRRIESLAPGKARLGDAQRPGDEPIRFSEEPALTFAVAAISGLERGGARPPRLVQRVIGFLGPNGALPVHLTDFARERRLHHADRTFGEFLNMLLHRFGLFFYRAWARAQPTVDLDRREQARIPRHVGALFGHGERSQWERDALGDFAKLHFAGRLSRSVRDADGLQAWVRLHFGVPVAVEQYCGHWMALDARERSRLRRDGRMALGRGAMLGGAVWDVQHKFRIVVGPLPWARFVAMLPGGGQLEQLQAMVRQYVGFEFEWDMRLILRREDVPAWKLGSAGAIGRLGRTSWMNRRGPRPDDAGELLMNVESICGAAAATT